MKFAILIFLTRLLFNPIFCQTKINAEYRTRIIIDDGYKDPKPLNTGAITYITQRTRLNIDYNNKNLQTYFSIQDIRYWGGEDNYSESGVLSDTRSLDIHQAWFIIKPTKSFLIKVGRQLFNYDDQRIIASRRWNDYQVKYDALLLKFNDAVKTLDIVLSWNSENSKNLLYPSKKFRFFDFVHYKHTYNNIKFSAIGLLTGNTLNDTINTLFLKGTYGVNFKYTVGNSTLRTSFYYQNNLNNKKTKLSAYCYSIFVNQKLLQSKVSVGIGLDYLSGHDETKNDNNYQNTNHTFNILYGKRHGFYGYMDYYSTLPDEGLQDYFLKVEFDIIKQLSMKVDFHYFMLAAYKYDPVISTETLNKNLGQEIDLTMSWELMKEATIQAGYSVYLTTSAFEKIKAAYITDYKFPQFAYLMISVKPEILEKL